MCSVRQNTVICSYSLGFRVMCIFVTYMMGGMHIPYSIFGNVGTYFFRRNCLDVKGLTPVLPFSAWFAWMSKEAKSRGKWQYKLAARFYVF